MTAQEVPDLTWQTAATMCRWGIVVICLILVPGAAFVGQGIGQWLRAQSPNRWVTRRPAVQVAPNASPQRESAKQPVTTEQESTRPMPSDSAAMYAGHSHPRLHDDPHYLPERDGEVVPASFGTAAMVERGNPATNDREEIIDRFADLERELQARGAISYVLESDRRDRRTYRFACVMPGAGPADPERTVEAFGSTALDAIRRAIRQLDFMPSESQ